MALKVNEQSGILSCTQADVSSVDTCPENGAVLGMLTNGSQVCKTESDSGRKNSFQRSP